MNNDLSFMQKPHYMTQCETCHIGRFILPQPYQEWHLECDECGTILFCYEPMPHQERFHQDPSKFKLFAGGKKSHSLL